MPRAADSTSCSGSSLSVPCWGTLQRLFSAGSPPAYGCSGASILFLLVLFSAIWTPRLRYASQVGRLTEEILFSADFRSQPVSDEMMSLVKEWDSPGEAAGLFWLESDFLREKTSLSIENLSERRERWAVRPGWSTYLSACRAVWDDVVYFPVASASNRPDV